MIFIEIKLNEHYVTVHTTRI